MMKELLNTGLFVMVDLGRGALEYMVWGFNFVAVGTCGCV